MKLARKFTIALVLVTLAVLAVSARLSVGREISLSELDMQRDHRLMGRALGAAFAAVWKTDGEGRAIDLIKSANEGEAQVRMRWIPRSEWQPGAASLDPSVIETLLRGEEPARAQPHSGPDGQLLTYVPVYIDGAIRGAFELSESLKGERRYEQTTILHASVTSAVLLALCGIITGWLGLAFIGKPMRKLVEQARRVGAGDFTGRLALHQRDEISDLAREMNAMCQQLAEAHEKVEAESLRRIAALDQLRHADRLTTVGKLASGVAHELGTPLNVVSGRAKMIVKKSLDGAQAAEHAQIIADQAARMAVIIRQLLDFARRRDPKKTMIDIRGVAVQTLAMLEPLAQKRKVAMEVKDISEAPVEVSADSGQIQQVLTNLVVNAIQAMPQGGDLWVDIQREDARPPPGCDGHDESARPYVRIRVRDQGAGIAPDIISHIFEPFFTTKGIGEGTGLGLSVSYGIVKEHGGWIDVESDPGRGSSFSVYLPAVEAS